MEIRAITLDSNRILILIYGKFTTLLLRQVFENLTPFDAIREALSILEKGEKNATA